MDSVETKNFGIMPEHFRLARAYVPFQVMCKVYDPQTALVHGTVFPELFMPYKPRHKKLSCDCQAKNTDTEANFE